MAMRSAFARVAAVVVVCGLSASRSEAQFAPTCAGAPAVGPGTHAFNMGPLTSPNATVSPECAPEPPSYELWTSYVPTASGKAFITLTGLVNGPATVAQLGFNCEFPGFLSGCASTDSPCTPSGLLKLDVTAGEPVTLVITGRGAGKPSGTLQIVENPASGPGDTCATAIPAALGTNAFSAAGSVDNSTPAGCRGFDDIWFVYVPSVSGGLTASVCGEPGAGSTVNIYLSSGCTSEDVLDCGNFNENGGFAPCRAQTAVSAGEPVYIRLTQDGCFTPSTLTLSIDPGVLPSNDACANAAVVGEGDTVVNNTFATSDGADDCSGGAFGFGSGRDLWCVFTPAVTASYDFSTGYDSIGLALPIEAPAVAVYTSCENATTQITSIACSNEGFSYSYFRVPLQAGQPYVIRIAGAGRLQDGTPFARGDVKLKIRRVVPPTNDLCANATPIGSGQTAFDLRDASTDGANACGAIGAEPDVWFVYTPSFTGTAEIGLVPDVTNFPPTLLAAAEVTIVSSCVGGTTGTSGLARESATGQAYSRLIVPVVSGQALLVRVAAEVGFPRIAAGTLYTGPVRAPLPPANDTCAAAAPLGYRVAATFDLTDATKTAPPCYESGNCFQPTADPCTIAIDDDLYYAFVAPSTRAADIRVSDGQPYPFGGVAIAVLDSCSFTQPPTLCGFACGDAPRDLIRLNMLAGQQYLIRVGTFTGGAPGPGSIIVTCTGDFTGNGSVTIQDIFEFLSEWFVAGFAADFNQSGEVTVQDLFDFLADWFVGC